MQAPRDKAHKVHRGGGGGGGGVMIHSALAEMERA